MEKSDTKENIIIHTHRESGERKREEREKCLDFIWASVLVFTMIYLLLENSLT